MLLFVIVLLVAQRPVAGQELDSAALFGQAHGHFSAGNLEPAREILEQILEAKHPLVDYSLYYLAAIAFKQEGLELSRRLAARLRAEYPQSIWFHAAELQQAKIDIAEAKYAEAMAKLRSLRGIKTGNQGIAEEAFYLQATVEQARGNNAQAYTLYQEFRAVYPGSHWGAAARKEIARLRADDPDQFGLTTRQAILEEADRLVKEREHGEAASLYKKLLNAAPGPEFRLRLLTSLADVHLAVRKRVEAMPFLKEIAAGYSAKPEAAKALYQLGQILWNRHDNLPALDYFRQVIERHPKSTYVARSQFATAYIYEALGKSSLAMALYNRIPARFPASQPADDAMWRLAWLHYRNGDLTAAHEAFGRLAAHGSQSGLRTAGLYWQSRCVEKSGDIEQAKELYRQVYRAGPESYYHHMAVRALERLGSFIDAVPIGGSVSAAEEDPPIDPAVEFHLSRARTLADIALHQLAVTELDEINRMAGGQDRLRALLMREYFRSRAYNRSLAIANQLSDAVGDRQRFRYPLAYWEMIQSKAQERNLDPYLVVALIRQESLFDSSARSPAFALGLMQVIPPTARRVAKQLGLPPPSSEDLFDPELNLTLGTEYLKDLLGRYSNNWPKAIAAYNAGENAVDRWEKQIVTEDMEEFVERIPYLETRNYVKLVLRNHHIYRRLYQQSG